MAFIEKDGGNTGPGSKALKKRASAVGKCDFTTVNWGRVNGECPTRESVQLILQGLTSTMMLP